MPARQALQCALRVAEQIATMSLLAVQSIRDAVKLGADVPLETALSLEHRLTRASSLLR